MANLEQAKGSRRRFTSKHMSIIFFSVLIAFFSVAMFISDAMKAEVSVSINGEEETVHSTAETVEELLTEIDLEVGKHDELSKSLDAPVEDGMELTYNETDEVIVTIGNKSNHYYTTEDNVQNFLNDEGIELSENDQMSVSAQDDIRNNMHIAINKALEVTINDGGEKQTAHVPNQTVENLLNKQGITLDDNDRINVDPAEKVKDNQTIEIVRVSTEYETVEKDVPHETETREDDSILQGESEVVQSGQDGKKVEEYKITKENGEEVSRELVDEEIVEESENRVVAKGTKQPTQTAQSSSESSDVQQVSESSGGFQTFTSTKYTANCSGCSGVTATGVNVSNKTTHNGMRIIAVDPSVIPLHSRVEVKTPSGSFTAIALDTGGAINGNKIDILASSKSEAYRWGHRTVQVRVLD
ncbi:G5 and 3D domain-containing protein [Alkalibacillus salilacus]|uniref:Uncharacterized protein YabE (DUF348 family) n=1 Tax=Alkalibacillus salilacus TaxID=284582 RepID=A0ABT9VBT8_9BACI|nr:G5 and 3D domain-containing protein [Alkalibacillus salilacus]MDQ0158439.1 uncharacterized protein YabE (DUF348 family) [Alkalibacillus salilacus]